MRAQTGHEELTSWQPSEPKGEGRKYIIAISLLLLPVAVLKLGGLRVFKLMLFIREPALSNVESLHVRDPSLYVCFECFFFEF